MGYLTLADRSGFRRVLAQGKSARSNGVRVHWTHNGMEANRYGVAATVAVGGAVRRNMVRRWSRALLRAWDEQLHPGHDVVVFVNHRDALESYSDFAVHLASSLRKAQLTEERLGL